MPRTQSNAIKAQPTAHIGVEPEPWSAGKDLRGKMDLGKCNHSPLGLIFLKLEYSFDSFQERCLLPVVSSPMRIIKEGVVDCPVALTGQFVHRKQFPVRFGSRGKNELPGKGRGASEHSLIQ